MKDSPRFALTMAGLPDPRGYERDGLSCPRAASAHSTGAESDVAERVMKPATCCGKVRLPSRPRCREGLRGVDLYVSAGPLTGGRGACLRAPR